MASKDAKIDAALSALTSADGAGSQDGADANIRVDAYGALWTRAVGANGVGAAVDASGTQAVRAFGASGVAVPVAPSEVTLLASAARTASVDSATQTNTGHSGVVVVVDMTAVGTGSITLTIQGYSTLGDDWYTILAGAAITTNVVTVYRVFPAATAAANATANDYLPGTWRISVVANNANAATYSANAILLP